MYHVLNMSGGDLLCNLTMRIGTVCSGVCSPWKFCLILLLLHVVFNIVVPCLMDYLSISLTLVRLLILLLTNGFC